MSDTVFTFKGGPELEELIQREQERLAQPGVRVSRSDAIRSLVMRGSAAVDRPEED